MLAYAREFGRPIQCASARDIGLCTIVVHIARTWTGIVIDKLVENDALEILFIGLDNLLIENDQSFPLMHICNM
ncbi:hypothetical protein ABKN59_005116 [Abortiporus biennis]